MTTYTQEEWDANNAEWAETLVKAGAVSEQRRKRIAELEEQRDKLLATLQDVIECDLIPELPEPSLRTKARALIAEVEAAK